MLIYTFIYFLKVSFYHADFEIKLYKYELFFRKFRIFSLLQKHDFEQKIMRKCVSQLFNSSHIFKNLHFLQKLDFVNRLVRRAVFVGYGQPLYILKACLFEKSIFLLKIQTCHI